MSGLHEVDVAIVGAGPAGLAAAIAARSLGASVLVIDEYSAAGGQYHRQSARPGPPASDATQAERQGRALASRAREAGVAFWADAYVWAAFANAMLAVDQAGMRRDVRARSLVVSTGAHDRVMPFPGWTLPGVMTVGAAQALVKAHAVVPGQRIVVAGSGPFLLVVAEGLAKAGAAVEILEAARFRASVLATFLRFPNRWGELLGLLRTLRARGVGLTLGRVVMRAEGQDGLQGVVSQAVDARGTPIAGTVLRHDADALAIAYGFRTQVDLARMLGCRTRYDDAAGGHAVIVDADTGRTSQAEIYAAGEVTGVGGHEVAALEGTIAGLSAAMSLGYTSPAALSRLAAARRGRAKAQRFADVVAATFAPSRDLALLPAAETIVCRCEGVTRDSIDRAIAAGATTASAVKRWTRCGMGRCQGRMCGWGLARLVAARTHSPMALADNLTARLPLKPVSLGTIAGSNPPLVK